MRIKRTLMAIFLSVILLNFPACNKIENLSESGSALIVLIITGTDLEENTGSTTIFSDVITSSGSIVNDTATATLSAMLLDPLQSTGTFYQDIIVDQIDVEYVRSDMIDQDTGNSTAIPGVDVPFGFSQKIYARVVIGETLELPFVLVQQTAKLESPLLELVSVSQEKILKMEARCTFHGKDGGGHRIAPVVGTVSVWFANFADTN
jgi:hypothetical protein